MGRKTKTIAITDGRDAGKIFLLTEMSARKGEWWAARVLTQMSQCGVQIPDSVVLAGMVRALSKPGDALPDAVEGMAGLARLGVAFILSTIGRPEMKPLLDEMLEDCVSVIPDQARPMVIRGAPSAGCQCVGGLIEDDIEEITTLAKLRREVLLLHLDFFPPDARLILTTLFGASGTGSTPAT